MRSGGMARGGARGADSENASVLESSISGEGKGADGRDLGVAAQPLKNSATSTPPRARNRRLNRGRTGTGFSATMGALAGVKLS